MSATNIDSAGQQGTDEERYDLAFRKTRQTLDRCIEILMEMEHLETNSTRRNQVRQRRRELDSRRVNVIRASEAYYSHTATMNPPSAALVAQIDELSRQAVALTAQRTSLSAVLELASSALEKFAQVQQIGGA